MASKTPVEQVEEFLNKGGFPLEMRTARAFQEAKFLDVQPGEFYIDPDEDKPREIDLTVSRSVDLGENSVLVVTATIECKRTRGAPWVAFPRSYEPQGLWAATMRASTSSGHAWLEALAPRIGDWTLLPLLHSMWRPAYGLVATLAEDASARGRRSDRAYEAMMTASKAAAALCNAWSDRDDVVVGVALPLIVVDGDLCEAHLGSTGAIEVNEADRVQVLWRNPIFGRRYTIIDVVTERHLPEYVGHFRTTVESLATLFEAEARTAAKAVRNARLQAPTFLASLPPNWHST